MLVVVGVGVVGTVGAFVLGPWALNTMYDADLSGRTLAMLSLSSAVFMLALATAQAVIALKGHALVALGWAVGVVAFGSEPGCRAMTCSSASRSASSCRRSPRSWCSDWRCAHRLRAVGFCRTPASMMEAITDMPFET